MVHGSGLDDLKRCRDLRGFGQHDAGGAVLVVAHRDGTLDGGRIQAATGDLEVHIDAGEDFGVCVCAFAGERHAAASDLLAAALEDQDHVVCRAAPGARQDCFHRAGRQVGTAIFGLVLIRSAVHHQNMTAARLCDKAHR